MRVSYRRYIRELSRFELHRRERPEQFWKPGVKVLVTPPLSHGTLGRVQGTAQAAVINGPFQVLIAGVPCSYPRIERVLVPKRKNRPPLGSRPSQRAARTRKKWPCEKIATFVFNSRTRATTRSALSPTCSAVSPLGQG